MATARPRSQVEQEIRDMLGLVPSFFERIPDAILDYEWTLFKRYEFEDTALTKKAKQLIGVAIHSETKCRYCSLFHTEVARLFGATEEEIQDAVHYAKHTVGWSTYLNGIRQDFDEFENELKEIIEYVRDQPRIPAVKVAAGV